ncbi:dof zinc finger protein DOF3.4-like [Punica granatum]|uniref:Dof zinc finger protein n=2 Tax=Punica granatum TaxID=22663 RepID=A0A218WR69_PUNGR|nr:dof zinc finger protein DOF3.4-like [Punica granatum]OWM74462.1 hypothetical protein CDL15_Pgr003965 [Punica granatum]PKH64456.1 hypothetical protein CRG98_050183 [Punica granatum]
MPSTTCRPAAAPPPPNSEAIPCPRCDSINTKFCYYNNYNLAQPRHFCKSCRRYWTQGGTLRNVPVGGGSRKSSSTSSSKRLRSIPSSTAPPASSPASTSSSITNESVHHPPSFRPDFAPKQAGEAPGAFTSLLTSPGGHGFLALGGFGTGYGPSLDGQGLGFGRSVWPFPEVSYIEGVYAGAPSSVSDAAAAAPPCNAWQLGAGEGGGNGTGGHGQVDGADGFAWPELAISMPGQGLK